MMIEKAIKKEKDFSLTAVIPRVDDPFSAPRKVGSFSNIFLGSFFFYIIYMMRDAACFEFSVSLLVSMERGTSRRMSTISLYTFGKLSRREYK